MDTYLITQASKGYQVNRGRRDVWNWCWCAVRLCVSELEWRIGVDKWREGAGDEQAGGQVAIGGSNGREWQPSGFTMVAAAPNPPKLRRKQGRVSLAGRIVGGGEIWVQTEGERRD